MKERPITMLRGETAIIDEDDFGRIKPHSWYINGGYPVARINGKRVYLHAFLLGAAPSGFHIDHINRDKLDKFLRLNGADCRRFWHPIHTQEYYKKSKGTFAVSTQLSPLTLWLPSAFTLKRKDILFVASLIKQFYGYK